MNYKIKEIIFEYQHDGHMLNGFKISTGISSYSKITSLTLLSNIKEINIISGIVIV